MAKKEPKKTEPEVVKEAVEKVEQKPKCFVGETDGCRRYAEYEIKALEEDGESFFVCAHHVLAAIGHFNTSIVVTKL